MDGDCDEAAWTPEPTQEEIRQRAASIRAGWDEYRWFVAAGRWRPPLTRVKFPRPRHRDYPVSRGDWVAGLPYGGGEA